jgi:hypothetical protein
VTPTAMSQFEMNSTFLRRICTIVSLILAFTVPSCWAQQQPGGANNQTSNPVPGVGHDYIHMLNETVNPANGSVSLRIQVPIPKGRGLTLPFAFAYDSAGIWAPGINSNSEPFFGLGSNPQWDSEGGWSYLLPTASSTGTYL